VEIFIFMELRTLLLLVLVTGCVSDSGQPPAPAETPGIPAGGDVLSIRVLEVPAQVEAGELFSVWWEIEAGTPTRIPMTAVFYDRESHPGDLAGVSPPASGYSSEMPVIGEGPYLVPDEFEAFFRVKEPGRVYLRVVAEHDGRYYWSDEMTVEVKEPAPRPPKNQILNATRVVALGESIRVTWGLKPGGSEEIESSRLYFDDGSNPGNPSEWKSIDGIGKDGVFEASITPMEPGFLYLKTLVVAGGQEYWSDQRIVTVMEEGEPVRVVMQNWSYNPEVFHIPRGTTVEWVNLDDEPHHPTFAEGYEMTVYANKTVSRTFTEKGIYLYFDFVVPEFEGYIYVE
jgi:plastocyanin